MSALNDEIKHSISRLIKMRNLEILTHFQGALSQLTSDETVIKVCVDEFSLNLFVLTSKLNLLRFAYGRKPNGKESDNLASF